MENNPFNNDLTKENFINRPASALGLPKTPNVPFANLSEGSQENTDPIDLFKNLLNAPSGSDKIAAIPLSSFSRDPRYSKGTRPGDNWEEAYAQNQSKYEQAFRGTVKGLNLAGTTVAGGFGTLYGIGSAFANGDITKIWNNPVNQQLQAWNEKVDREYLPNFYTEKEQNAEWWSKDNWITTNFLFDKLIKNSGYAVGAMVGGNIANSLLSKAGTAIGSGAAALATRPQMSQAFKIFNPLLRNTARAFSQGKNIEATNILKSELSSIADATQRANQIAKVISTSAKFAKFGKTAQRGLVALYSSAGEASMEAIMGGNQMQEKLIKNFIDENGYEPAGADLDKINETVKDFGKTSFFGNLALLGVTEYVQLPYLAGSSWKNNRTAIRNSTDDVIRTGSKVTEAIPTTRFGKLYKGAKKYGSYVFDPKEAGQEVGQYALEVGASNYFEKSEQTDAAEGWVDSVLSTLSITKDIAEYGLFGTDEEGKDVGALVSKEGIEGGILGGITGGLMSAFGKTGKIKQDKQSKLNTKKLIEASENAPLLKEVLNDRLKTVNRGVVLQQQQQDSVAQNDILESKDLKTDIIFNYAMHKIKFGRTDLVIDEIQEMKKQVLSEEDGFAKLQQDGIGNVNDTKEDFLARLNEIESTVVQMDKLYENLNTIYGAETITDPESKQTYRKYSDTALEYMAYSATKISDYDKRIVELNNKLSTQGIISGINVLESIIENNKPNREAVDETLKQINALNTSQTIKNDLKSDLTSLIEISLRRKSFLQEYDDVVENPSRYVSYPEYRSYGYESELPASVEQIEVPKDRRRKPVAVEKKLEIGKEYSLDTPLLKKGSELFIAPKITILSQTLGGEFKVKLPNGEVKFLTPTEFKEYSISDEDNTSEEMAAILDKAIDTVLNKEEYLKYNLELNIAGPENIYDKRAFVNDLDDQALIDDIEKEFNAGTKDLLEKRKQEKILKEKLLKAKQTIDAQQKKLENNSGDVESVSGEIIGSEDKRKDVDILFLAGTSPSEDTGGELVNNLPHIKRSRRFLNNFKFFPNRDKIRLILVTPNNAKELGLEGIVQLSYNKQLTDSLTEEETNTEMGFMAQVFIIQTPEGNFFINEKGEKLNKVGETNPEILNNIVFQTMTSASPTTISGSEKVRAGQEAEAEIALEAYKLFRKDVFAQKGYTPYSFAISRGIPRKNKVNNVQENNNVEVILGNSAEKLIANENGLIKVVTTGKISHQGQLISYTKGAILIQYGDLLDYVNNKRLTNKQANNIFAVIDAMSKDIVEKSAKNLPIKLNWNYSTFLQNVLYWRSKGDTSTPSQISIDTTTMEFKIGKEAFPINKIAENKQQIMNALQDAFITVNNKTLAKGVDTKFTEYVLDKEGNLTPVEWKNYQTYLLSSKNPDGSTRSVEETPLITHTSKTTDANNSYKQKYAYITDKNILPYSKVPAKKTEAPKPPTPQTEGTITQLGEYKVNTGEVNTYDKLSTGPVLFTATVSPEKKISVNIQDNDTIVELSTNQGLVNVIDNHFKKTLSPEAYDVFNLTKDAKDKALFYLNGILEQTLEAELKKLEAQQNAPKSEQKKTPPASTNAKADIEKRRQEELAVRNSEIRNSIIKAYKDKTTINLPTSLLKDLIEFDRTQDGEFYTDKELTGVENIKKLKESISKEGLKEPLEIAINSQGAIVLAEGNHRIQALIELGYTDIPVKVIGRGSKEEYFTRVSQGKKVTLGLNLNNDFNEDKINAKYDAELAALENKEEKTPEEKPYDPSKRKRRNDSPDYRRVGKNDRERMSNADFEAFKQWHAEKVPNIPFEDLNRMVITLDGEEAWGVFENGVAKFVRGGLRGTEYHEIGHGIWTMLSAAEQEVLLNEFRSKSGSFTDRVTGKAIEYAEATDLQAEERIWDDFADYRLGKLPARSLGERVRRLFKMIMDFFKTFGTKPSLKKELFEAIDSGRFKETKLIPRIKANVILPIGTSGSGKSTFIKSLPQENLVVIEPDVMRVEFTGDINDKSKDKEIYIEAANRAVQAIKQGRQVVFDTTNLTKDKRLPFIEAIKKEIPNASIQYKLMELNPELAKQRIKADIVAGKNRANVPDSTIDRHAESYKQMLEDIKNEPITEYKEYKESPKYRAVEGLTEEETNEYIQDMVAQVKLIIFQEGRKDLLFNPEKLTGEQVFSLLREEYEELGEIEALGEKRYNELVKRSVDFIRTLGISFNPEEVVSINDENSNSKDYTPEVFSVDWKKHSTGALKFLLSTLTERKGLNQTNVEKGTELKNAPINRSKVLGGYKILNFNRVFATLLDRLHNTNDPVEFTNKFIQLVKEDSNYLPLFKALGGNPITHEFDFSNFGVDTDWRLFIQFFNTFSRQKPDALIQYVSEEGDVHTGPANIFTTVNQNVDFWVANMKTIGKSEEGIISYDKKEKVYKIDRDAIKGLKIKKPADMLNFLAKIGVDFPIGTYEALSNKEAIVKGKPTSEVEMFNNAVASIYTQLGSNNDLMTFDTKRLEIRGPLRTLATLYTRVNNPNQDSTYFGVEGQRIGSFSENNAPSYFENTFNESETLQELLEKMPQLKDVYSAGSQVLKEGGLFFNKEGKRIAEVKVQYIQGSKNALTGKDQATAKLAEGERFVQEINQNINGNYYVLIPGDSSTEWMMNLGNTISMRDVISGNHWDKVFNIYSDYLNDDINLALENRKQNLFTRAKSQELRIMRDILPKDIVEDIEDMIKDEEVSYEDIQDYISDNKADINESIKSFIEGTSKETINILLNSNQVSMVGESSYYLNKFDTQFLKDYKLTGEVTYDELLNVINFVNINYAINNQEYHKILFGDPYQFKTEKGKLDETKRIKSFLSGRRRTFDHPEYNNKLKEIYNTVDGIELDDKTPGHHNYKAYTNTVTFADVEIVGSTVNINTDYIKVNETDAMSWLMDNTHKEIALKEGQWSNEAEAFHQWHMAYTRRAFDKKGIKKYANEQLRKRDAELLESPMPKHKLAIRKPIISGNKFNKTEIDLVLDKTSQMPLYYHMVEGTSLEKIYEQMFDQNIGYGIVVSGRKVGSEGNYDIYVDGKVNTAKFENIVQVPWKIYGTQVETMSEGEKTQTRGSQLTKGATTDLYENGEPIGATPERKEVIEQAVKRNTKALQLLNENAYNELLNKLGVVDLGDGYALEDKQRISETLMYEMMRRDLSENAKDTIALNEDGEFIMPFEASPSYTQIKNILYSMVNKALISPAMNGAPHVQIPVTMFEQATEGRSFARKIDNKWVKITKNQYKALTEEEKKSVMLTDDTLKFYEDEDGKRYCEVMLPHWFKGKFGNKTDEQILKYLDTAEGKKILTGIGFRIPTQALSSVEVFRVKGFLPQYMGYTVVVPSEITTKAGSDFDIDKLNMYLKSVYTDRNGNVRLVKYQGTETATKDFFAKVYDDVTKAQAFKKAELIEAVDTLIYGLDDTKKLLNKYGEYILSIQDKYADPFAFRSEIEKELEKLTDDNINAMLRQNYTDTMYKKSLENEYYESLEELLTLPENFNKLISPVDDAGLEKISELLDAKRGYSEAGVKGKLINRNFMTKMRHGFITGKRWVGIAAVNITNLSLRQKSKVYLDPAKVATLSAQEKTYVKDLDIILPHNTLEYEGNKFVSLSGTKTADGKQFISDRLSGYATAFVDIANKPFITKIIKSDVVVSTFMFLESIGAGNTGIFFLNQPIIEKYLEYLDSTGSKSVLNSKKLEYIKNQFPTTKEALRTTAISVDQLLDNIQEYGEKGKFNQLKNAEQQLILNEFLKYKILADQLFSYTQATNYDTTRFGSSDALLKKEWATFNASNFNLISNVDEVLANTFIGKQADLLSKSFASFGAIMKTELPEIKAYTISTLKKYATRKYMSSDDYEKIANLIKNSFVDYVIQNNTTMSNMIKPLLVDAETAVVSQLEQAKQKYPNIQLLQDLSPVPGNREGSAKSIQLKANVKDAYSENLYVGMMRELRDTNAELNDLYNNIVNVAILQGTTQSAISIRNIIPVEDYAAKIAPIIQQLTPSANLDSFANGMFERNNFANKDVFQEFTPYALESDEPIFDPNTGEEYTSYFFPNFRKVKGASKVSRKLISLNDKYNSFQLSSDFIKIPKVITTNKGVKINVATGLEITKADYAKMKAKGDFNLYDAFYYKKVYTKNVDKFNNPIPLMTYNKKIDAYDYYYKLINVYGDGNRAVEFNTAFTPSVINNGSITIANELNDQDIVNELAPQIQQEVVSLPAQISEEEEILNSTKDTEALLLKLGAKKVSKGQLNIDGQYWYLNKDNWSTMAKKVNNELYLYPEPGQEIYVGEDTAGNYKFTTDVEFYKQYIEKINAEKTVIKKTPERVTINLQPDNRNMIANGKKTTTIRTQKEFEYIGLPVGATAKITINGLEFNVTNRGLFSIDEVGKEAILKSEGLTSSEDFKFPTSKKWFDGQGKLYIYDFTKAEVTIDEQLTGGISYETVERYTDADVKANPDKLYIFGDNTKRIGTGGQAQIRNNSNAMGIATKLKPSNESDAFMSDDQFEENKQIIDSDITKIVSKAESTGKTLVFPADGFGTGLAQLPTKAPKTYDYLRRALYDNFGFWNGEEQPPSLYLPKDKIYKTIFDLRNTQIDYTPGQRKALEEIASLIDKKGDGHYLLAGYAGTGKTTIAENIAKYAKQAGKSILVIAPTNKAAKVLNDKLKSTGVGSVASTIHKTIYGEPNDQGEWEKSADIKNSVIIIDESSMIEKSLMADLLDSTKNKGNVLIFMGDSYQLQPVGEDSGLFQGKVPEVKNNQTELTEVKRQSLDSNILKVATVIRNDKQSYVPKESTEDFKVTKSKNEFVENFKQAIKNNEDVAMIVATNNERLLMNKLARTAKFGEAAKNILNPNETIISIANSSDYSNSEVFNIKDVRGESTKFDITFTDNFGKTSKYDIYLAYVVNNDGLEVPTLFLPAVDKPSIYHAQILKAARESNSDLYNALSDWTMRTKKGEKLSPAISIATYGYAITAHKSQGSQWKKVFVNQNYVADSWDAARWFYTAITRASDEVEVLPSSSNIQIANTDIDAKLNAIIQENAETFDNTKEISTETEESWKEKDNNDSCVPF